MRDSTISCEGDSTRDWIDVNERRPHRHREMVLGRGRASALRADEAIAPHETYVPSNPYHAEFDAFAWRDTDGTARFAGQRPKNGRHRYRVWPALAR